MVTVRLDEEKELCDTRGGGDGGKKCAESRIESSRLLIGCGGDLLRGR